MTQWLAFGGGVMIGFAVTCLYAAWANRGLETAVNEQSRELRLWRRGWVPRDWHDKKIAEGESK